MNPEPRDVAASRIATLPTGEVAHVVVSETTTVHDLKAAAFGRWHDGRSWSGWRLIAQGVRDIAVAPASAPTSSPDGTEPAVLVTVVAWSPPVLGAMPASYVAWTPKFYLLTPSGVAPAGL